MCQLVLVLLAVVAGYAGAATIPWCCTEKSVGGVNYTLVNTWENTTMYGCEWDCVYEQNGLDGSRVCFKEGGLPVVCYEDECVFPNSQYKGSSFNNTVRLQNHTDCQKLCKDHNKINHNNQKKCNYWNFSPPVYSTYTSNCDMYENKEGIEQNTGNGTFRGPINKYCPYLECVFPNSLYNGTALLFSNTQGLQNHTDCQKLCKDHNKINDNNQKKCNYWDFSEQMHSPYTSYCNMYENITGIYQNTGKGAFRGPINEYCPYLGLE